MIILKRKKGPSGPYTLDPTSHRYRICPNPFCGKEHMVSNIGRQYCCDKCADEHYRYKVKEGDAPAMSRGSPAGSMGDWGWPPGMVKVPPITPITPDQYLEYVKKNVAFLDAHNIDPVEGTVFEKNYLIRGGFNLHYHSGNPKVLNIDPQYGCKYLLFEKYMLVNISDSSVLIGFTI